MSGRIGVVERLVADVCRVDPAEARRLVDEARDLVTRRSLLGEPLPPRYPHTAEALAAGAIGAAHLPVVRRTMARLEDVAGLEHATLVEAERFLAEKAAEQPPCGPAKVAARLLAQLDPDGQAPDPPDERDDEVHVVRRRDGSLDMRARFRDPAGAALIDDGLDVMATPAGPDDQRALPNAGPRGSRSSSRPPTPGRRGHRQPPRRGPGRADPGADPDTVEITWRAS